MNSKVSKKKSLNKADQSPRGSQEGHNEDVDDNDDGVEWQTDTSIEIGQKRIKEQLTLATSEMVMLTIPEEGIKQHIDMKDIGETVSKNTMVEPEDKPAAKKGSDPQDL